jgi:hypothetical protein
MRNIVESPRDDEKTIRMSQGLNSNVTYEIETSYEGLPDKEA